MYLISESISPSSFALQEKAKRKSGENQWAMGLAGIADLRIEGGKNEEVPFCVSLAAILRLLLEDAYRAAISYPAHPRARRSRG
jgi:hypothetical protein